MFWAVNTIITEAASFSRPSSPDRGICCSLASNAFFRSLDLGKIISFSYDNIIISITHFGLKFLSQSKAVFTEFGLAVWPIFSDMDHLAKHHLSLLTSSLISIGSPNATTVSHSSFLNVSTSLFRFMIWLNSSKNFAILLDPQYSRTSFCFSQWCSSPRYHCSRTPYSFPLVDSQAVTVDSFGESRTVASLYPPTLRHSSPGSLLALCQEGKSGHCFFSRGRPRVYVLLGVTESFFLSLPFDHFGCMSSFQSILKFVRHWEIYPLGVPIDTDDIDWVRLSILHEGHRNSAIRIEPTSLMLKLHLFLATGRQIIPRAASWLRHQAQVSFLHYYLAVIIFIYWNFSQIQPSHLLCLLLVHPNSAASKLLSS